MSCFDRYYWLPIVVVLAILVTPFSPTFAQVAEQAPVPPPIFAMPQAHPTPENIGESLMGHHRYQAAIEIYKKLPNKSAGAWNQMGIAYQMMFNFPDAARCYQASLKLNSKNATVLNNMGTLYDSLKQFKNGERMYHKALKVEPKSALTYKNLGTNLLAQRKYTKGWEAYQAALTIDPHVFDSGTGLRMPNPASIQDRGATNYYLAKSCARAGMPDKAIEYLRAALNEGYTTPKKITEDSEFASLRGIPAFEQLLTAQTAR
jgi:tetratricopeptide (TPR) repeat protein